MVGAGPDFEILEKGGDTPTHFLFGVGAGYAIGFGSFSPTPRFISTLLRSLQNPETGLDPLARIPVD